MTTHIEVDVVVVGAGLVGLSAAIAFAKQGKKVVLVDAKPIVNQKTKTWDARIYALSPDSEAWLKTLGVWRHADTSRVCPIDAMHLWHAHEELILSSSDANLPKLGVIIESQNLMHAMWQEISVLDVSIIAEQSCVRLSYTTQMAELSLQNGTIVSAKLVIGADSLNSWVRQAANITLKQKDFGTPRIHV